MFFFVAKVVVIMRQVEEQEENEKKLEARYQKLVAEPGPHSPGLEIWFSLQLPVLYKLVLLNFPSLYLLSWSWQYE